MFIYLEILNLKIDDKYFWTLSKWCVVVCVTMYIPGKEAAMVLRSTTVVVWFILILCLFHPHHAPKIQLFWFDYHKSSKLQFVIRVSASAITNYVKFVHSTWTQTIQIQHWDKNLYALSINYSPLPWVLCHLLALALNKTNVQFQILHGLYTMQIQIISGSLGHSFSSLWVICALGGWLVMYSPCKRHWCHPFYLCSIHFLLSPAPAWCWWWLGPDLAPGHGHQRNWVLAAGWSPAGTSTSPALPRHISGAPLQTS